MPAWRSWPRRIWRRRAMARRTGAQTAADEQFKTVISSAEQALAPDVRAIRTALVARILAAADTKLAHLKQGQALGIIFRLEVINADGTLMSEPSARTSREAAEWRHAVFERDAYCCRECGIGRRLNAHHLKHWADAPDLRFDVDNGVTLCVECHAAQHPSRASLIRKAKYHRA